MSEDFYGSSLNQREEHEGPSVPFAGHRVFGVARTLRIRVLNPNVAYADDGTDIFDYSKVRFVSGSAYCSTKQREGHAYGHLIRVIDATNVAAVEWLYSDLLYTCIELLSAGWPPRILLKVLVRVLHECPCLAGVVSMVSLRLSLLA